MKTKKELYYNQSNLITNSLYKTESSTALKLIKYSLFKLDKYWKDNEIYKKNYEQIDLFEPSNWKKTEEFDFSWEDFTCTFTIGDFCNDLKISCGGNQRKFIEKAINTALKESIMLSSQEKTDWFPWFVKASFEQEKNYKQIKFIFNPAILAIALSETKYYTNLELEMLGKLNSLYAIRFYELIKSRYNMKGKYKYGNSSGEWKTDLLTFEFIRDYLQIPEGKYSERMDNFRKYVINNPINEINKYATTFQVNVEYIKGGRKGTLLVGIVLHCKEKIKLRTIKKEEQSDFKYLKAEQNETDLSILKMKEKYPMEWQNYEKIETAGDKPFMIGMFKDAAIYESMIKDGFVI